MPSATCELHNMSFCELIFTNAARLLLNKIWALKLCQKKSFNNSSIFRETWLYHDACQDLKIQLKCSFYVTI